MARRLRAGAFGFLLALGAHFAEAFGAGPPEAPAGPGSTKGERLAVEITLVGPIGQDATLPRRITSWFDGARFQVTVRASDRLDVASVLSPGQNADVFVWVTAGGASVTRLYFSSVRRGGGDAKYLLRDLASERGLDEIGSEHVAQVLYFSSVALIEGQLESRRDELERSLERDAAGDEAPSPEPGAAPPPMPPPPPERAPKGPPRAARAAATFGVGYGASLRGDEGPSHGPRGSFALGWPGHFGLRAAARVALPSARELGPVALTLYGASFVAGPTFSHALGAGVGVTWFAGPGLDVVHYAPRVEGDARLRAGGEATDLRPVAAAGASVAVGRSPRAAVVVELPVSLGRWHYDVKIDDKAHTIGAPWRVTPVLGIEVQF